MGGAGGLFCPLFARASAGRPTGLVLCRGQDPTGPAMGPAQDAATLPAPRPAHAAPPPRALLAEAETVVAAPRNSERQEGRQGTERKTASLKTSRLAGGACRLALQSQSRMRHRYCLAAVNNLSGHEDAATRLAGPGGPSGACYWHAVAGPACLPAGSRGAVARRRRRVAHRPVAGGGVSPPHPIAVHAPLPRCPALPLGRAGGSVGHGGTHAGDDATNAISRDQHQVAWRGARRGRRGAAAAAWGVRHTAIIKGPSRNPSVALAVPLLVGLACGHAPSLAPSLAPSGPHPRPLGLAPSTVVVASPSRQGVTAFGLLRTAYLVCGRIGDATLLVCRM